MKEPSFRSILSFIGTMALVAIAAASVAFASTVNFLDMSPMLVYPAAAVLVTMSVFMLLGLSRSVLLTAVGTLYRVIFASFRRDLDEYGFDRTPAGALQARAIAV